MTYDFLIIGSGLAGLYSAYTASGHGAVALVTKSKLSISNSSWAQGGVAAVIDPEDSFSAHIEDTLVAGRGLCNKKAVEILVADGSARIKEIIDMNAPFDLKNGKIALGLEGGHTARRILHAGGDATGKYLVNFFIDIINKIPNITVYEDTYIYDLLCSDNTCFGAKTINFNSGKTENIYAGSTFLATGGAAGVYHRTTNPKITTGDGIALAYNNGADISGMEFIQFHPSAFYREGEDASLISEAVRGEGAHLLNHAGERFMKDIHELAELAPRDIVAASIFNEMKKSGKPNIYISLKHLDAEYIRKRFSSITQMLSDHGLDLATDLIPISPAAHYTIGGIKTNLNGQTKIRGLYALGEASSTGVHGANRLASNSLLECLVFGKRTVEDSIQNKIVHRVDFDDSPVKINNKLEAVFEQTQTDLAKTMVENVGIVRSKDSLQNALQKLNETEKEFPIEKNEVFSNRFKQLVTVQKLITSAALAREETRGGHRRSDFDDIRAEFDGHFIFSKFEEKKFIKTIYD